MSYTNKIPALVFSLSLVFLFQVSAQDITLCNNESINVDDLIVTSDSGMTIDVSACTYVSGDLVGYMNCIAENNELPDGASFNLEILKGDVLNGVSTIDLVLMHRDILKIEKLDDSCKVLAADVNGDNKINVKDLALTRLVILGWLTDFPIAPWKFYKSNELNITGISAETELVFAKEDFPLSELKIKGVKVGDVNYSVIP